MEETAEQSFTKWICGKCRYKFTHKSQSKAALRCPYCGGENLVEDNFTAKKLLDEVE